MSDIDVRAAHAQQLIDDPLLTEVFDSVRTAAVDAWIGTGANDTESRELAWITVKIIDRIKVELESMVESGIIAAKRVQAPLR